MVIILCRRYGMSGRALVKPKVGKIYWGHAIKMRNTLAKEIYETGIVGTAGSWEAFEVREIVNSWQKSTEAYENDLTNGGLQKNRRS